MKALVTNCTRNSGLAVMRALSGAGWSVQGSDDRVLPFGLRSRCTAAPYEPMPAKDDPRQTNALLALLERTRPDVLIAGRAVEAACNARTAVLQRTRSLLSSHESFAILNDKERLLERCAALGIPAPRVFAPDEAERFLRAVPGSRVVIKPRRDVGGGDGVHFVTEPSAVVATYHSVTAQHGGALITEYIPGPTDSLRAVHLLFDSASRLIAFFIMRKLRIYPAGVGGSVAAVSTHETGIVQCLLPLFQQLQWQGPADAELKIDARDGLAKIIEINPRFSGAIHFPIACGVNMPLLFCRAALGERLDEAREPAYPAGMHYIDAGRWLLAVSAELRKPGAKRGEILRRIWNEELRRPRVASLHRWSDPGPIIGKLLLRPPFYRAT
jgi:predicted ATP-grasp superfamily ATP-dependent carboligase